MSIVHSSEHAGFPDPATPARVPDASSASPSTEPIPQSPRPAWSRTASPEVRAQAWVKITLGVVLSGILLTLTALPGPRPTREAIEAQRAYVDLRLTLAELRAVIAEYHAAHGSYPGRARGTNPDPLWLERELEVAFRRTAASTTGSDTIVTATPVPPAPYLPGGVPPNPLNHRTNVRFLSATEPWPLVGDDTTGWLYRPATGEVRANSPGVSPWSGKPFLDM